MMSVQCFYHSSLEAYWLIRPPLEDMEQENKKILAFACLLLVVFILLTVGLSVGLSTSCKTPTTTDPGIVRHRPALLMQLKTFFPIKCKPFLHQLNMIIFHSWRRMEPVGTLASYLLWRNGKTENVCFTQSRQWGEILRGEKQWDSTMSVSR